MPKLWIQVVGTQRPTQVQYEDGDNVDDLITAAKAKMPNTLTADPSFIKASKDEGGQDELPVAFLISDLKKENSSQNPIWLHMPMEDTGNTHRNIS